MMRRVGLKNGSSLPLIGMGTWRMGEDPARRGAEVAALRAGLDLGIDLIDTAEMYAVGNAERIVGEAIKGRRDQVYLVSKVLPENAGFRQAIASCEGSLQRLGTDRIDLYLLHWRGGIPFQETIEAFRTLKAAGKIGGFGVSNLDLTEMWQWCTLASAEETLVNQLEYNIGSRGIDYELLPWLRRQGIATMAYCPLAQGNVDTAGRMHWQGQSRGQGALARVAERHGASIAQIMLAWCLRDDGVMAIAKSTRPERLAENLKAVEIVLSAEDIADLDRDFPAPTGPSPLAMT